MYDVFIIFLWPRASFCSPRLLLFNYSSPHRLPPPPHELTQFVWGAERLCASQRTARTFWPATGAIMGAPVLLPRRLFFFPFFPFFFAPPP